MSNSENKKMLALYNFASKQEYIYRTSKIREISGASKLLSEMYGKYSEWLTAAGMRYNSSTEKPFCFDAFDADAEVLYEGGGSLMVLYKDEQTYLTANRIISAKLLQLYPGIVPIACAVPCTGNFEADRKALYQQNILRKNRFAPVEPAAVTPMTQVDPMTFAPVVRKESIRHTGENKTEQLSLSADRVCKRNAYPGYDSEDFEGLTAIIYIDGNSMGKKLKSLADADYDIGVNNLRAFSANTQRAFVTDPLAAIKTLQRNQKPIGFRQVIGDGDEVTIICRAQDAITILKTYFESLSKSKCVIPQGCFDALTPELKEEFRANYSCAGIAVIHAKSPFTVAYELAEAACKSAKKRARSNPGNYFDCYYCHAGATADFETLRKREQSFTGRPYAVADLTGKLQSCAYTLQKAGRANVKTLGTTAQLGETAFCFETKRVNAYLAPAKEKDAKILTLTPAERQTVYDISEFYDLWVAEEAEEQ